MTTVTLSEFIRALRSAGLEISALETLDAHTVAHHIGWRDRQTLANALELTLAKTAADKRRFHSVFDRFFPHLSRGIRADGRTAPRAAADSGAPERFRTRRIVAETRNRQPDAVGSEAARSSTDTARTATTQSPDRHRLAHQLAQLVGVGSITALPQDLRASSNGAVAAAEAYLNAQIRDYTERVYEQQVDATGQRTLIEAALSARLQHLPRSYFRQAETAARLLAARLAKRQRSAHRNMPRGVFDLHRTLRRNVAYDGTLFQLEWRRRRRRPRDLFVLCDVSRSVRNVARVLLVFLHALRAELPRMRAYAFSNSVGEITDSLQRDTASVAVERAITEWGSGTTDYGAVLAEFHRLHARDLNRRTAVLVLGDARSNHLPAGVDTLRSIYQRAGNIYWLNPEARATWGTDDSMMHAYRPFCARAEVCARLSDIERFSALLIRDR